MATTFIREQLFGRMKPVTKSLAGRTIVVSGSNTGLGLQTAIHLARLSPSRIILACRNLEKAEAARKTLLEAKGVQAPVDDGLVVECWELDMASFASVKAFAKRAEGLQRLDIAVLNAGIATHKWSTTADGWESTLQVNGINTGLLGLLLLPKLKATAALPAPEGTPFKPHLTIVGSEMHLFVRSNLDMVEPILTNLNKEETFQADPQDRYSVTKLMNIWLAHGLAALVGPAVIVNVVNPGLCVSEFRREMTGVMPYVLDFFARTAEQGSLNIAWAATEDTSAVPGAYVSVSSIQPTSAFTRSEKGEAVERKCWDELMACWSGVAREEVQAVLETCRA